MSTLFNRLGYAIAQQCIDLPTSTHPIGRLLPRHRISTEPVVPHPARERRVPRGSGDGHDRHHGAGAVLALEVSAAGYYAGILIVRERSGRPIATADAQIAAMCLAHHAVCATRNTKDFVGTGIEPADPWVD